ncbi:tRNA (5-methylaminomethyl-2-thiouridine)(34)-methyltransferase MnmD [Tropicimonas sp. S265A]|uniref:tRNA (5-methylaminomethyl-2-thiouridine)(34)-methyltransferase MnmD n=1 Tax=Tropicimonas sp. S265A TaxID=3415134 RepID=UPI003C7EB65B
MKGQEADLTWTPQGVPISRRFEDPYFSMADGLSETRHVFLRGNGLPKRFANAAPHHVAELGFGTGLTLAVMRAAHRDAGLTPRFRFTSFEAFPMPVPAMREALAHFSEIAAEIDDVLDVLASGGTRWSAPDLDFELIRGDARKTLPDWPGTAQSWCLDGFSPAKNPELWDPALLQAVADHTAPGGRFATYTAAGHVRRALAAAGFEVSRVPGFGRKRHMSVGRLR